MNNSIKYKLFLLFVWFWMFGVGVFARQLFVATDGEDSNSGSIESPFATLKKAESLTQPGDTVYIRGGLYAVAEDQIMDNTSSGLWSYVFNMVKSGTQKSRICYFGYPGERPVFDLSDVKPANKRVIVFYVKGSYLHFRNFEIVGTQVTILEHTQSECFRNDGGSNNIYENLAMHDGMAIGFYIVRGSNNLVLNCDAYNNYDSVSEGGAGGNVDGFGGHVNSASDSGNIFKGCRAWYNSDDGFDLISCNAAYTIDSCWSFYNGYKPGTLVGAGDGTGFKAGGYGMGTNPRVPDVIPVHVVQNSLAYYNKNKGFYSNHHLGGIIWYNNTGFKNPSNFSMLNRKSAAEAVDVPGYGHVIKNNVSYSPRSSGKDIIEVDQTQCDISHNTFLPSPMVLSGFDFISTDDKQLTLPRKEDGSLPDIDFLRPKTNGKLIDKGVDVGLPYSGLDPDLGCFEYMNTTSFSLNHTDKYEAWISEQFLFIKILSGTPVQVYDLLGVSVFNSIMPEGIHKIRLNAGYYIVKFGKLTKKIKL